VANLPDNLGGSGAEIKILSLSGETVTIDAPNTSHPLAGKKLYFDVEVLDIK
jgi:FKBP-type peptidyl-prolyl cis-trans isomerase 2